MNGRHCSFVEGDLQDGLGECEPEHCSAAAAGTPCPYLSEPCPWPLPCRYDDTPGLDVFDPGTDLSGFGPGCWSSE